MPHWLQKVFLLLMQAPLIVGWWLWWKEGRKAAVSAILISVAYEAGVFAAAFIKEVWALLKADAVRFTADWIKGQVIVIASGFRRRYKAQVIHSHGMFNVRGLGLIDTYRLRLDQVFVDLRIDPSINLKRLKRELVASEDQQIEASGNSRKTGKAPFTRMIANRPIWDFLRREKSESDVATALAVIGPPGCGKTTLLQHVAVTLAANRQHQYHSRAYIPVLLFLRDHVKAIVEEAPTLGNLAQDYFENKKLFAELNPPPGWFEKQLKSGNCIVLLDGLDEVAELKKREAVSKWIDRQIEIYYDCRFVVTARPQGFIDAPVYRADVLWVQPFNAEQVKNFVHNWNLANEIKSSGNEDSPEVRRRAKEEAEGLLRALRGAPALNELTVNPLLLTMIAMVHRYHGALPGSRVELYSDIFEALLRKWQLAKGIPDALSAAQKLLILRPLAAILMGRKTRDISDEEAKTIIEPLLKRVGYSDKPETFLSNLQDGSGLLFEREVGYWSFAHLTFQEYLTASQWLEQKERGCDWSAMVGDSWWHESLRLYAAQGNATSLIKACLIDNSLSAMTLAADCLDEAREIDEDVRRETEEILIAGLESSNPDLRRLAAEVKLSRRLKKPMHQIDDRREIDLDYVTCAEYQLFLDEMREQGKYHQPDHWTQYTFPEGHASEAVSGVRAEDAEAFCEWLTQREGGSARYRLPEPDEAEQNSASAEMMATWCKKSEDFKLAGPLGKIEQILTGQLSSISNANLPRPQLPMIDLSRARAYVLDSPLTRAIDLDSALSRARDRAYALDRALALDRDIAITIALDRVIAIAITIAITIDRNLTRDLPLGSESRAIVRASMKKALLLSQIIQSYSDTTKARRVNLLINILVAIDSDTMLSTRRAYWRYYSRILEYAYKGHEELQKADTRLWRQRWRWSERKKYKSLIKERQQVALEMHWWLQIIIAREEGKLPAWEGIRIVREQMQV